MKSLSRDAVDAFAFTRSDQLKGQRRFVELLVANGPEYFVSNACASAEVLEMDGRLIPLVISDSNPGDSTVCSIEAHYVEAPYRQLSRMPGRTSSFLARPFLILLRNLVRAGRLGRVVYFNNWLMTTNPEIRLNSKQVDEITRLLISRFPGRTIVIRSVNGRTGSALLHSLQENGYHMARSRRIYVFDPNHAHFKMKDNLSRDLHLLKRWAGPVRKGPLNQRQIEQVARLYGGLYLGKYSSGNPDFTLPYFETVINGGLFESRYLEEEGEMVAFTAWKEESDSVLATLIGYDLSRPRKMGLYRMALAIDFKEALERGVPYNFSSGAGHFKRLRGAVPTTEYDALYFGHLAKRKQTFWKLFLGLMYLAERFEGEIIDFRKAPSLPELKNGG